MCMKHRVSVIERKLDKAFAISRETDETYLVVTHEDGEGIECAAVVHEDFEFTDEWSAFNYRVIYRVYPYGGADIECMTYLDALDRSRGVKN